MGEISFSLLLFVGPISAVLTASPCHRTPLRKNIFPLPLHPPILPAIPTSKEEEEEETV